MIYAIEAVGSGRVKFGRSVDPEKRLRELATGSPFPLKLLVALEWPADLEVRIHDAFREARCHGEWFVATYRVEEFVNTMMCPQASDERKFAACVAMLDEVAPKRVKPFDGPLDDLAAGMKTTAEEKPDGPLTETYEDRAKRLNRERQKRYRERMRKARGE